MVVFSSFELTASTKPSIRAPRTFELLNQNKAVTKSAILTTTSGINTNLGINFVLLGQVLGREGRKPGPVIHGVEVGAVLDHHVLVDVLQDPPVFLLKRGCV